jgi:hypothetical protein
MDPGNGPNDSPAAEGVLLFQRLPFLDFLLTIEYVARGILLFLRCFIKLRKVRGDTTSPVPV